MNIESIILVGSFFLFVFLGLPVAISIALSSFLMMLVTLPSIDYATLTSAQTIATGVANSSLMAIPFFIFSGCILNSSGLAKYLIDFAKLFTFGLPSPLWLINVVANTLFGAISGSASAAAVTVGKTLHPLQEKEDYDKPFSVAVNITSCPIGLLVPPSNALIIYAIAAETSIAALFWAGYIPGIIMGLTIIISSLIYTKIQGKQYPKTSPLSIKEVFTIIKKALPILGLIFVIIGGISFGIFSPSEASGIAVVYSLILGFAYKTVNRHNFNTIVYETIILSGTILFLIASSVLMSWILAFSGIPKSVSAAILSISDNPIVIMLMINFLLLIVGMYMDLAPAVLIFTPIFLPVILQLNVHPIHFGIIMIYNLCIGLASPPVGLALFVGCSVGECSIESVLSKVFWIILFLIASLMFITYVPALSLWLPKAMGLI